MKIKHYRIRFFTSAECSNTCVGRSCKIPDSNPAIEGITDDENSGLTIKSIPSIAIIIAVI